MQHAMATDPAPAAPVGPLPPSNAGNTQAPQASSPSKQPQQTSQQKVVRIENNISLGAIQIMTGLVHIGLGALSFDIIIPDSSAPEVTLGGYPFWGGVFFIVSGSLTVLAANYSWNSSLMRMSVGLNFASTIVAVIGIALYVFQLSMTDYNKYEYDPHVRMAKLLSVLLCSILICFSLLEFFIAIWAAVNGDSYQIPVPVAAPYTFGFAIVPSEGNPPPTHKTDPPK